MAYKVAKNTDKCFVIEHPDGSTFTVPKKGISKAMLARIEQMPGYAEGGPISDVYTTKKELEQMPPEERTARANRLLMEGQAAETPSDMRFYPGVAPYAGQPEVRGTAPALEEPAISPIDFITPGMVTAPVKALAKGAISAGRAAPGLAKTLAQDIARVSSSEVGAVGPGVGELVAKEAAKKAGPRMVMPGMYSKAEQLITEKMGGSATPQQVMGILKEAKPEEIEYLGIPKLLEGKNKISKPELLQHIQENLPQIQQKPGGTKFSSYTTPGGSNYDEKLYQLNPTISKSEYQAIQKPNGDWIVKNKITGRFEQAFGDDEVLAKSYAAHLSGEYNISEPFISGHFDEKNILAHARTKEFSTPKGKTLLADEIQSDWHQAGRAKGYISSGGTTPDAPLKKSWHEFVSKRLLHDAAESNADNLAWTTGATQAERYNLAKQVDEILAQKQPDGTFHVVALKNGENIRQAENLTAEQLESQLGKDLAKKIVAESGEKIGTSGTLKYTGDDLKVGGEGMKGFYDKIIPEYMAKLGKKYNVKPEKTILPGSGETFEQWAKNKGFDLEFIAETQGIAEIKALQKQYKKTGGAPQEVWNMKLTPEMKQDILKKGFPLFTGVAAINAQTSEAKNSDGFAKGGKIDKGSSMGYKIIHDTKDFYQVLHPDGSKFTVPKKGISKQMHEKIMGMEKFAVGGKVSKVDEDIFDQPVASEMPDMDNEQPELPEFMRNPMDEMAPKPLPEIGERVPASVDASMMDRARPEARQIIPVSVPTPVPVPVPTPVMAQPAPAPSPAQTVAPAVPMTQKPESTVQQPIQQTPESAKQAEAVGVTPVTPKPMAQPSMTMPVGGSLEKMQKGAMSGLPAYYDFLRTAQSQIDADQAAAEKRTADLEAHLKNQEEQANKILEQNKIDPGRKWANMSIGNKILAGISIALGGIGAGLTGSNKNYALDIINKAIDDDIEAQKSNRDSAYNNLLQISKNREAVLAAQKADALQRVQNSINKMALQAKGLEAQQAAQKLWNELEVQRITLRDKYTKELSGQLLTQYAASGAKMRPEEIVRLPDDVQPRFINGIGIAPSPEAAQKVRPIVADAEVIKNIVNQLKNLRQTYGREVMPLEASTMAQGLGQVLIGKLREPILGPGTMQEAEYERLKKLVPTDATAFFSLDDNTMARLDTIENMVMTNLDKTLLANNMTPKPRPKMISEGQQQGLQLNK